MGAWTTRIFDDDGAMDIKAEYRILLGYGVPNEEAYRMIKDCFYKDYARADEEDVYWLCIALYQWQNGVLMEEVKENALRCIDNEEYLERWKDSGMEVYEKRKKVLKTLREKLLNETNPVKKVAKCPSFYRIKTKWKTGDLLAYRILQDFSYLEKNEYEVNRRKWKCWKTMVGKYVLLRVVGEEREPVTKLCPELDYTSCSQFMLYDWVGEEIPSEEEIRKLPFRKFIGLRPNDRYSIVTWAAFHYERRDREYAEIIYLGNDPSYAEHKPEMYLQDKGWRNLYADDFNRRLIETFTFSQQEIQK